LARAVQHGIDLADLSTRPKIGGRQYICARRFTERAAAQGIEDARATEGEIC
jgi:hypothetical protein